MSDFDFKDEELHEILGLSLEKEYIPTFISKPAEKINDQDSLSSVADIISQDTSIKENINDTPINNTSDQLQQILLKLEENTQRVNGIADVFRKEIINQFREREESLKIQTEKLDLVFIFSKYIGKNQEFRKGKPGI
jgi:hypothetical protein